MLDVCEEAGTKMDLSADHEQLKPRNEKSKRASIRSAATQSSKREGRHDTSTDRLQGTKTGVKHHEANIPITTRTKTPLQYYESRPLMSTCADTCTVTESKRERPRTSRQGLEGGNTRSNSSEPQPLDLKAIIREYMRKKEEANGKLFSETNDGERELLLDSPVVKAAVEVADVVQGSDSVAATERKQALSLSPTANAPPMKQQDPKACKPRGIDVLFGRGRAYRNHPGNKILKRLVKRHRDEYEAARCRDDKTNLSWTIVLGIIGGGARFLKRDKARCDQWFEVLEEEAREKVSHALRDGRKKPAPTPPTDPSPASKIAPQPVCADAEDAARLLSAMQQQRRPPVPTSKYRQTTSPPHGPPYVTD